jgi:C1A family cysteine protease
MLAAVSLFVASHVFSFPSFNSWATYYGKQYPGATERDYRNSVFDANVRKIYRHNTSPNVSWTMAVNKFADLTGSEFKRLYTSKYSPFTHTSTWTPPSLALPASVDWTTEGVVTPVKDQGQCGSCWAFSATGSIEGAWAVKNKVLYNLSEQELVDCSVPQGNQGCNGGLMDHAFQYVVSSGLVTDAEYPYTATDGPCMNSSRPVVSLSGFNDVPTNSEVALMTAVVQQPVSVAVEADQSVFQFYSSGVMTKACGTNLDHGVLLVGYGTVGGKDYYKVKNSWGADWGDKGYILLGRGPQFSQSGQCGIQMDPSFPVV